MDRRHLIGEHAVVDAVVLAFGGKKQVSKRQEGSRLKWTMQRIKLEMETVPEIFFHRRCLS